MHDLLTEPLIGIRTPSGNVHVCLPELLARLCADRVDGYTALRPHQADPWHVFLVQLAASVLARHRPPSTPPVTDPEFWRTALLDLADHCASVWHLVGEDVSQPALLQHPLAGGAEELASKFRPRACRPDELDVLVTARNHDVKMARATPAAVDAWLHALLTYQTISGYPGSGNYGSIRMNGGFGSRAIVAVTERLTPSGRFCAELEVVLAMREETVRAFGYRERGVVLTWLKPWDRTDHQFQLADLEPWFIEAVRPVRLCYDDDRRIFALSTRSDTRQVGPEAVSNGVVGDPWIPVKLGKSGNDSALTLSERGWTAEMLTDLLLSNGYRLTRLQRPREAPGDVWFYGSTLVRGQGKTGGYHRFEIKIPAQAKHLLLNRSTAHSLGTFGKELLADARHAERALHAALMAMAEGGPDSVDFNNPAVSVWARSAAGTAARRWEDAYFPTLWRASEGDREALRADWRKVLAADAEAALTDAECRLPLPCGRRWKSLVRARSVLRNALKKRPGW
jgi:CRISPR system Cascade subunit CasA